MDIFSEKWMINRYLECVNDSNNVYKIKADVGIKIRSAWHTYYNIFFIIFRNIIDIGILFMQKSINSFFCSLSMTWSQYMYIDQRKLKFDKQEL